MVVLERQRPQEVAASDRQRPQEVEVALDQLLRVQDHRPVEDLEYQRAQEHPEAALERQRPQEVELEVELALDQRLRV